MTVRLSINLADDTAAFLRERAAKEGRTVTEIVRRMASVYQFITDTHESGRRITTEDQNGKNRQVVNVL